jgi:hypothetical protein
MTTYPAITASGQTVVIHGATALAAYRRDVDDGQAEPSGRDR